MDEEDCKVFDNYQDLYIDMQITDAIYGEHTAAQQDELDEALRKVRLKKTFVIHEEEELVWEFETGSIPEPPKTPSRRIP